MHSFVEKCLRHCFRKKSFGTKNNTLTTDIDLDVLNDEAASQKQLEA